MIPVSERMADIQTATILGSRTHQYPGLLACSICRHRSWLSEGKLLVEEVFFEVPKVYEDPTKGNLRVFARTITRFKKPADPSKQCQDETLPFRSYFNSRLFFSSWIVFGKSCIYKVIAALTQIHFVLMFHQEAQGSRARAQRTQDGSTWS